MSRDDFDFRLVRGTLRLADDEQALTEYFEDVVCDWARALRRPMSIEQRELVEAACEIVEAIDPERAEPALEDLAPTLGVVSA